MNFNWSKTKEVNLLFSGTLKTEGLLKALDVDACWKNYLTAFDDYSCLKGQETTNQHLLEFNKRETVEYTPNSSIVIEFANTDFSLDGIYQFAEKYGRLGLGYSFDLATTHVELANAWLWELANVKNVLGLILYKQTSEVDKFSKLLKINLQTGLWEYENNRYKTAEVNFPVYIFPTGSFEICNNKELIRFKEDLNSNNLPQVIDDILSVLFFNFYRDRVKPVISSNNKFSSEIQPISLIGFIWHELFKIIENNNLIKNCRYCKDFFPIGTGSARSDKVYCSNSCVVNGTRTEAIFKKYEKDLEKKGYVVRKSNGNTDKQFDYWLIDKNDKLIGGLDITQSSISEFSQKWNSQCKIIQSKLETNELPISFLINKEGRKYLFTQDSPGSFIEQIPSISYFDELLVGFYYTEGFKKQLEQAKKDLEETKKQHKKLQENLEQFKELSRPEDFFRDTFTEKDLEIPILGENQKYKKDVA
jgi:hypothetical protein